MNLTKVLATTLVAAMVIPFLGAAPTPTYLFTKLAAQATPSRVKRNFFQFGESNSLIGKILHRLSRIGEKISALRGPKITSKVVSFSRDTGDGLLAEYIKLGGSEEAVFERMAAAESKTGMSRKVARIKAQADLDRLREIKGLLKERGEFWVGGPPSNKRLWLKNLSETGPRDHEIGAGLQGIEAQRKKAGTTPVASGSEESNLRVPLKQKLRDAGDVLTAGVVAVVGTTLAVGAELGSSRSPPPKNSLIDNPPQVASREAKHASAEGAVSA